MSTKIGFRAFLIEDEITTNCREEEGITVGMVDGLIAQIRILRERDLNSDAVREALLDLGDDEDFAWLCSKVNQGVGNETR